MPMADISSRGQQSSYRSLDDADVLRIRSSSSFGWYDGGTAEDETHDSAFRQIDDWREIARQSAAPAATAEEEAATAALEGAMTVVELRHENVTTTKTWQIKGRPVPYAVAIGAIRVLKKGGAQHAQYQVVLSTNSRIWRCWKRFSDFKLLAEYARLSGLQHSIVAWTEVQSKQRLFRCLEEAYLRSKCLVLERFMAQLLFELPSPSLLLTFVQAPIEDTLGGGGAAGLGGRSRAA